MARTESARRREENEVEFSRIVAFSDGVFAIAFLAPGVAPFLWICLFFVRPGARLWPARS